LSAPKLLDRVRWHLRVKHYSIRTEQSYVDWIRRFILFHGKRHPTEMGEPEIAAFLTHLAVGSNVAASTQNQAFSALLFLYQQVLDRKLEFITVERVRRPPRLPVVFTRAEARAVLARLKGDYRIITHLLYGSGLRLLECLRLRVKDIDLGYRQITVREGKGLRERVTILPDRLLQPLQAHLGRVKELHQQDLARGAGAVYLPGALHRNIPRLPGNGPGNTSSRLKDYLSILAAEKNAVRDAVRPARRSKAASCHTFRHSFATHLLEKG
jgi:integrase